MELCEQLRCTSLTIPRLDRSLIARGIILIKFSSNRMSQPVMLGPLEMQVMDVAWSVGRCSVRDVVEKLDSKLAYTTVMTTLDRLFKKGLLARERRARVSLFARAFQRGMGAQACRRSGGRVSCRAAAFA